MMTWIFLLHGLMVLFFTAKAQGQVDLDITRFEREEGNTTSVCIGYPQPDANRYDLTLDPSETYINIMHTLGNCIPFKWNIAGATGEKYITLEAKKLLNDIIGSDALSISIPEFPLLTSSFLKDNSASYDILRIQGDKKSFTYSVNCDFSAVDSTAGDITEYFFGFNGLEVTPCSSPPTTVSICDMPLSPAKIDIKEKIKVDNAILKYNDDGTTADLTLSISNSETQIGLIGFKSLDIIVKTPSTDIVSCIGNNMLGITDRICTVPWKVGNDEADIRLVEKNYGELFDYKEHVIKDCELLAGVLDDSTLEVRWLQFGTRKYRLTAINKDGTEVGNNDINCSDLNLVHCFAYFILPTGDEYSVRLQESNFPVGYKRDSQIQSKSYKLLTTSKAKKIQQVEIEWLQHDDVTWAVVCFNHSDTSSVEKTAFSRYEFVMINGKGQWLKHQLISEETGARCFTPLIVDMNAFDVSQGAKLIVTQRAKDGFTVLESASSLIKFNGNF